MSKSSVTRPILDLLRNMVPMAFVGICGHNCFLRVYSFRRTHSDRTQLLQQALERRALSPDEWARGDNSSFEAIIVLPPDLFDDYDHWIWSSSSGHCRPRGVLYQLRDFAAHTSNLCLFWGDFCDWYVEASRVN